MPKNKMLSAGSLKDLEAKGKRVVTGPDRPIVVFYNGGNIVAVDNRCPHMGFPLHKGECSDGIITCPWHYARFDANSGCTFDLFAGDAEPFDVEIRGDEVFVSPYPRKRDIAEHAKRRLLEGMETSNALIMAKAILTLRSAGVSPRDIVKEAALYGVARRDSWGPGLTSLTALANLHECLSSDTLFLALYQSLRRVSANSSGTPPRRERFPLETTAIPLPKLGNMFDRWIDVRQRDAAERTLLTAIENGATPEALGLMVFSAATRRLYADGGHTLDFCNKAFEVLDVIGWEHAGRVLPTVMAQVAAARGGEEQNSWRHPVDIIALIEPVCDRLPDLFEAGSGKDWHGELELIEELLSDDPAVIVNSFKRAIVSGASPGSLGKCVAYAAARRVAQFASMNEVSDWVTALHTFTYCHAVHQAVNRCPDPILVRGVLHGAISVYLDRFLNVPAAKMPVNLESLPSDGETLRQEFIESLDRRNPDDLPARLVARYLDLNLPFEPLVDTLTLAVLREDLDFHTTQMLEAAVQEYSEWGPCEQGRTIFVALARYVAAMAPTQRTQYQTARIALKLHRGDKVYEEEE